MGEMAIDQWIEEVKVRHILSVFPTERLRRSRWGPIFDGARDKFNELSAKHKLGVKLETANDPPAREGFLDGGADVQFDFTGIPFPSFRFRSEDRKIDQYINPVGTEGYTAQLSTGGRMLKAFIFVPMYPLANFDREVNDQIKLFIAVHELIHAAGCLSNSDHSPEATPDCFCGPPISTPSLITDADPANDKNDKVELKSGRQLPGRFIPPVFAPPITLSGRTVGLIQKRWK